MEMDFLLIGLILVSIVFLTLTIQATTFQKYQCN